MLMWILGIVVYAFFIYGLFEFFKNSYRNAGKHIREQKIRVLITDNNEIEYLIRILKKEFNKITIILSNDDEETRKIIESLSKDVDIEVEQITTLSKIEKS